MTKFVLLFVLMLIVVIGLVVVVPKKMSNRELEERLVQMQEQLDQLQEELRDLNDTTEKLRRGDPDAIEKVARDKYGMSKEGEDVYKTEPMK